MCAALGVLLSGCSESKLDFGGTLDSAVKKLISPRRTPQQYMLTAVSDPDADARRTAVAWVAKSKKRNEEWAIKGLIAISLLESDAQTRCVAVRALADTGDPRAAETCLRILNHENEPPAEVRPPTADCRWEAAASLARLSSSSRIPDDQSEAVREALLEHLRTDESRNVRIECARGLAWYVHEDSVRGLIDALRDVDFAVQHQCEMSLVRLTGVTHDCVFVSWDEWFKANESALFARAGTIPESRRPPYQSSTGKMLHNAKQVWEWIVPPRK